MPARHAFFDPPKVSASDYTHIWGDVAAVPPDYHATMNHPNRNPNSHGARPSCHQVHDARVAAGLTVAQAAALIHERPSRWERMESGDLHMHPASWELFQIKTQR